MYKCSTAFIMDRLNEHYFKDVLQIYKHPMRLKITDGCLKIPKWRNFAKDDILTAFGCFRYIRASVIYEDNCDNNSSFSRRKSHLYFPAHTSELFFDKQCEGKLYSSMEAIANDFPRYMKPEICMEESVGIFKSINTEDAIELKEIRSRTTADGDIKQQVVGRLMGSLMTLNSLNIRFRVTVDTNKYSIEDLATRFGFPRKVQFCSDDICKYLQKYIKTKTVNITCETSFMLVLLHNGTVTKVHNDLFCQENVVYVKQAGLDLSNIKVQVMSDTEPTIKNLEVVLGVCQNENDSGQQTYQLICRRREDKEEDCNIVPFRQGVYIKMEGNQNSSKTIATTESERKRNAHCDRSLSKNSQIAVNPGSLKTDCYTVMTNPNSETLPSNTVTTCPTIPHRYKDFPKTTNLYVDDPGSQPSKSKIKWVSSFEANADQLRKSLKSGGYHSIKNIYSHKSTEDSSKFSKQDDAEHIGSQQTTGKQATVVNLESLVGKEEETMTNEENADLASFGITNLCDFLHKYNLGNLAQICKTEMVDGELLMTMDEEDMTEGQFHLTNFQLKKLSMLKNGWRSNGDDNNGSSNCELKYLGVKGLYAFLKQYKLTQTADVCIRERIDGAFFVTLNETDFENEPFTCSKLMIKKLKRLKQGWRPTE